MSADEALAYVQGGWMRPVWDDLLGTLDEATEGRDLVAATELNSELSLAADAIAERSWQGDHPRVRIHHGLVAWAGELARTITPFLVSPDNSRPLHIDSELHVLPATADLDLAAVARRLAYSLSWFTSRARHPYALDGTALSETQQTYATALATAAMYFAVAHEMAHVRLGELSPEPNPQRSRARELAADQWALQRLIALDARKRWSLDATLPGVAVFFWNRVFYDAFAGIEPTPDATHPSALERTLALYASARRLRDEEAVALFAGVAKVFGELLPHVRALAPDQLAPAGELWRLLEEAVPELPFAVPRDIELTWRYTYSFSVEAFLVYLAYSEEGPLTREEIAPVERWLEHAPGLVIDALGGAFDGTLEETLEPGARTLRSVVLEMLQLLRNPYVREAVLSR
jgi:hypothetical protein